MQRAGESFTMAYSITNTTWDNNKKWAYLALPDPKNSTSSEILPQGQFYNFKPIKGMTYTQSILIDTDATYNPNGQPKNSWFTLQGHNHIRGCFEQLSETTYRFWSTYTWQLEDIALRAFDWTGLETVLDFRNSGTYIAFYKPKLEAGERPSDWNLAPEDYGWSATTLVPTQTQRYLWKFEYIYYSDGSVKVTQPVNISIAGADGTNGQTSHIHFAFADNATGGGFSLTTPKAYMGWYADFNESASNDPTKYKWSKWKGDEGAPGKPGADGKTSYFHIAYADSADGRTGFSFTESGQQYQGYYTDFTQSSSIDPTKYTWMDRRAGVEVGGRNLFLNSKFNFELTKQYSTYYMDASQSQTQGQLAPSIDKDTTFKGSNTLKIVSTFNGTRNNQKITFRTGGDDRTGAVDEMKNQSVMMSFWAKSTVANTIMSWRTGFRNPTKELTIGTDWTYYSFQLIAPENSNATNEAILHIWTVATVWVAFPKVERGTISTDYSEAPEDVQAGIDSKADQALTQDQLNALAERNNLIKAEMEAKASIDKVNQWITAYQNYVEANDAGKAKSEQALQDASARLLQLNTDVGDLKRQWTFIDTYMTIQNEGLIIGKSDGSAYAKFSNDRISLFSGGSEVMYISQGVLRIENGIFTKTIQIGRFRFETHPADNDMLILRYLGGV